FDPRTWPCGDELDDLFLDELTARSAADAQQRRRVGEMWWHDLLPRLDRLQPPPAAAALRAAGRVLARGERGAVRPPHLPAAARDPDVFTWTVTALWSESLPTTEELHRILDRAPDGLGLPEVVCRPLADRLVGQGPLNLDELALCRTMVDTGRMGRYPGVADLLPAAPRPSPAPHAP